MACPEPDTPLDKTLREDWAIERLRIPAERKEKIRYDLFRVGVHASSLLPDIDGLAARIRWQHTVSPLDAAQPAAAPDGAPSLAPPDRVPRG